MEDTKKELIEQIINLEWNMFTSVHNVGGPAQCQHDPETFGIMRTSQCARWPLALLISYLADLQEAAGNGRNIMTEKYGYMMEYTFPEEFEKIRGGLPVVADDVMAMIDEIAAVNVAWHEDVARRYPHLSRRTRPVSDNGMGGTSMETYLRCELKTWSARTVALYRDYTLDLKKKGINEAEENILCQMQQYGFSSLDDVEKKLAARDAR